MALDGGGDGLEEFAGDGFVDGVGGGFGVELLEEGGEAGEGLLAGLFVGLGHGGVGFGGWVFAGAHEAVACSVVGDGFVLLVGGLHLVDGGGDGGADAGVVSGIEAVDGGGDSRDVRWWWAVEDEGGGEVFAMGGEGEGFASTPAEAGDGGFAVGGWKLLAEVGGGVEVGGDLIGGEAGDGLGDGVLGGEGVGASATWGCTGEEVGGDDDVACGG